MEIIIFKIKLIGIYVVIVLYYTVYISYAAVEELVCIDRR